MFPGDDEGPACWKSRILQHGDPVKLWRDWVTREAGGWLTEEGKFRMVEPEGDGPDFIQSRHQMFVQVMPSHLVTVSIFVEYPHSFHFVLMAAF